MSDSESDSELGFGSTTVLLGYASKPTGHELLTPQDNFIGGAPVWFNGVAPNPELIKCQACSAELDLLAQLSCPLEDKYYDRILYIFSCHDPKCRGKEGSTRCIRGVHSNDAIRERFEKEELEAKTSFEEAIAPPPVRIGDELFGSSGAAKTPAVNPFANLAEGPVIAEPAKKQTQHKNTTEKKPNRHISLSDLDLAVGRYYCKTVEVEEEYLTPAKSKPSIKVGDDVMDTEETPEAAGKDDLDPAIAAIAASVSDPVFTKFVETADHNPDQILRYERGLRVIPFRKDNLLPQLLDASKIPGKRIHEVQLMPHLISELESADMIADGMEWGTIVVATSKDDELPKLDSNGIGYVEEWVGVQWEAPEMQLQNASFTE